MVACGSPFEADIPDKTIHDPPDAATDPVTLPTLDGDVPDGSPPPDAPGGDTGRRDGSPRDTGRDVFYPPPFDATPYDSGKVATCEADALGECACSSPGTCAGVCGDTYCEGLPPDTACAKCVDALVTMCPGIAACLDSGK
jgi:hypothetical protein